MQEIHHILLSQLEIENNKQFAYIYTIDSSISDDCQKFIILKDKCKKERDSSSIYCNNEILFRKTG